MEPWKWDLDDDVKGVLDLLKGDSLSYSIFDRYLYFGNKPHQDQANESLDIQVPYELINQFVKGAISDGESRLKLETQIKEAEGGDCTKIYWGGAILNLKLINGQPKLSWELPEHDLYEKKIIFEGAKDGTEVQAYIGLSNNYFIEGGPCLLEDGLELLVIQELSPKGKTLRLGVPRERLKKKWVKAASGSLQKLMGTFFGCEIIPDGYVVPRDMPYDTSEEDWVQASWIWYNIPAILIMDGLKEPGNVHFDYKLAHRERWKRTGS